MFVILLPEAALSHISK